MSSYYSGNEEEAEEFLREQNNDIEGLTGSQSSLLMCIPCTVSATCVSSSTRATASLTFSKVVLTPEETRVYQIPWERQQEKLQKKQSKPVNNRSSRRVSSNDTRRRTLSFKSILEQKRPTVEQVQKWAVDFEALITDEVGQRLFALFLQTEHSEENLQFWREVNMLRTMESSKEKIGKIKHIYKEYIKPMANKEVNIAGNTRKQIEEDIETKPTDGMFDTAQTQVFLMMHRQSYPRFVTSELFHSVLQSTYAYNSTSPKSQKEHQQRMLKQQLKQQPKSPKHQQSPRQQQQQQQHSKQIKQQSFKKRASYKEKTSDKYLEKTSSNNSNISTSQTIENKVATNSIEMKISSP